MKLLRSFCLTGLALSLLAGCASYGPGFTPDANRKSTKHVDLSYSADECVVGDDLVFVFRNKKPKKVKFWANPAKTYYWEIEYDSSKPDAEGDFFGTIEPIGCKDNHTITLPNEDVPSDGKLHYFPYKITVYECVDGTKGEEVCAKDPRIGILD